MSVQEKIEKYSRIIWENQLPQEEEQLLRDLLAGKSPDNYRGDLDSDYSLFFAYIAAQNAFEGYSAEQIAEFKAILQIYKMQRMQKIPAMAKVFKLLNENGIVPVLVKGAAMMCYYAPDIPRMMGDIDIWITPELFDKAVSLILNDGYAFLDDLGYHISVTSDALDIDIHRYIYKNGGDIDSDIFDKLIRVSFLGAEVVVLSPEEMLLHQLANRGQDITNVNHENRHIKWIVDCWYVLKYCSPDMRRLLEKAGKLKNLFYVQLTLMKLAELYPDLFIERCKCYNEDEYSEWLKIIVKYIKVHNKIYGASTKRHGFVFYAFYRIRRKWYNIKRIKIFYERKESSLKMMMQALEIKTAKDFIYRLKQFFRSSETV